MVSKGLSVLLKERRKCLGLIAMKPEQVKARNEQLKKLYVERQAQRILLIIFENLHRTWLQLGKRIWLFFVQSDSTL